MAVFLWRQPSASLTPRRRREGTPRIWPSIPGRATFFDRGERQLVESNICLDDEVLSYQERWRAAQGEGLDEVMTLSNQVEPGRRSIGAIHQRPSAERRISPFAISASVSTTNSFSRAFTRAFRSSKESPVNAGTLHSRTKAKVSISRTDRPVSTSPASSIASRTCSRDIPPEYSGKRELGKDVSRTLPLKALRTSGPRLFDQYPARNTTLTSAATRTSRIAASSAAGSSCVCEDRWTAWTPAWRALLKALVSLLLLTTIATRASRRPATKASKMS